MYSPVLPGITDTLARWLNAPDLPLMIATRKTVVSDIEVSPLDGITRHVNGNGTVTDYRFDRAGRLTAIEHAPTPGNATGAIFKATSPQFSVASGFRVRGMSATTQNHSLKFGVERFKTLLGTE